tara:strand:- start:10368 stop:11117 length:750 start_codon:yes stop_codon:yes gene_type:complete
MLKKLVTGLSCALLTFGAVKANSANTSINDKVDNTVVVLMGPPASGKGTHGDFISKHFNIPTLSTGDLLRHEVQAQTDLGKSVALTMQKGELIEDDVIFTLLQKQLKQPEYTNGFILDGFPRTLNQAKTLDSLNLGIDFVVNLQVPDEVVISRISGRRIHPASGRTYHLETKPPKVAGLDDVTQEPLVQRKDDNPESIKKRLTSYHELTTPATKWYQETAKEKGIVFIEVDATTGIEAIQKQLTAELKK